MEQFCIHFHEEKNGMTCNIALTALDSPSRFCVKIGTWAWMTDTCPHSYPIGDMTMTGRAKKQS